VHPTRLLVRTLGVAALSALVAASLPGLTPSARAAAETPTANVPALDLHNLDTTCKACDDFYQFATGGWEKTHTLPPGRPRWGGFDELAQRNRDELHAILEDAAKTTNAAPGSDEEKLGAFYRACMDTEAVERAGTAPLASLLGAVDGATDVPSLVHAIAILQRGGVDAGLPFSARADVKQSTRQIAAVSFGGLGLPDRDYYINGDTRSTAIRTAYRTYVATQLQNLGAPPAAAEHDADAIIALETTLAKATPERADLRDPYKTYNPTTLAQLATLAPNVPWKSFFADFGAPAFTSLNVTVPAYLTTYDAALTSVPVATWKAYLRYHVVDAYAPTLPARFEDASFAFHSGVLLGVSTQLPRWQRCTIATDTSLRDVLGRAYVAKTFPPASKARARALVDNLQSVLADDIRGLDWMSPQTKTRAAAKLAAFTKKIGYPDRWVDYSALTIQPGAAYAADALAVRHWNDRRVIARIGTATDRSLWGMTPPTVNAYYNPSNNEIVFPAGILGPPFFNANADDAVNYGAIGAVIGHEMTHGFDDQGRRFDAEGNLADWWTPQDAANFDKRAQCIVDQFAAYEPAPGQHENGRLVQGEAIADLGGLTIAYKAFERTPQAKAHVKIDGYTPEQRFFLAYAQVWTSIATDGYIRQAAKTNEHPVDKYRVLGTLANMPEFQAAFACAASDRMVRKDRCQIW
jgi:putative endopeptidase